MSQLPPSITLDAEWIVTHLFGLVQEWSLLDDAVVVHKDGRRLAITAIEPRRPDLGHLIHVVRTSDKGALRQKYSLSAFQNKTFLRVEIPAAKAADVVALEKRRVPNQAAKAPSPCVCGRDVDRSAPLAPDRPISSWCDLVLFDLDQTLIDTEDLHAFRGGHNAGPPNRGYVEQLKDAVRNCRILLPTAELARLRTDVPGFRLGVITRSPRVYAETVLATAFPKIGWDVLVAYEDVQRTKPAPDAIRIAAEKLNIKDLSRVLVVGDDENDILAAYQAGCLAMLSQIGWPANWRDKECSLRAACYRALKLHADMTVESLGQLVKAFTQPATRRLALEVALDPTGPEYTEGFGRIDERTLFDNSGASGFEKAHVMGRYFAEAHANSRYDFRGKHSLHRMTRALLEAKGGRDYPPVWVTRIAAYLNEYSEKHAWMSPVTLVTVIPARPERSKRLERFLSLVARECGPGLECDPEIMAFRDGVLSQSKDRLGRLDRSANIKSHLAIVTGRDLNKLPVVIIDDITTSGATLFHAAKLLRSAGASVQPLALAATVS